MRPPEKETRGRRPGGRVSFGLILMIGMTMTAALQEAQASGENFPPITYETFTLDNGLRVVLSVDRSAPIVATFVHYHVGSKNERHDRTGFAHFFEHLMFEGTKNIPRKSIDKLVQGAGGFLNAFTSFDETGYQIQVPKNELELALWIESERMLHAEIEDVGVETQRSVVKEERKSRYENQPYGTIMLNMARYAAEGTPYEWTPIGEAQYIDQASIDEFREFYREYYVPNNAVLSIVGDIDIEEARGLVERYFGGIPRGEEIERPEFSLPIGNGEVVETISEPQTPLPGLVWVYRTPDRNHPDATALEYLATILARGESSRLHRTMVDEEELALQATSFSQNLEMGGLFGMLAIGRGGNDAFERLAGSMEEIVEDVRENGVTEREFQKARNQIETSLASRFNSVLSRAMALATATTFEGDPNGVNTELDRYLAVRLEDVQRVARKYLVPNNRVVLRYVVPEADGEGGR